MYLKLLLNDSFFPKEFGENLDNCVYYSHDKKIASTSINDKIEFLGEFRQINLLIGANNSGKSRFLRGVLKMDRSFYEVSTSKKNIQDWVVEISNWYTKNNNRLNNLNNKFGDEVDNIFRLLHLNNDFYTYSTSNYHKVKKAFDDSNKLRNHVANELNKNPVTTAVQYSAALSLQKEFLDLVYNLGSEVKFGTDHCGKNKVYLPILRSIKKSSKIDSNVFENTIKHLYNFKNENIFTGLNLYDKVLKIRNNVKEERRGFEKFEKFLSKYFFNQKPVEIISSLDEDKHLILYVGGEENKIHDIGDGIQAIILLMFPIFTANNNTWVFIEEPETYLHPGLQKVFLETLINDEFLKTKNLTYYFTTHSNHFLDRTLNSNEISIFQFEKESIHKFNIKADVRPSKEVLDILGVNTSSVFLANTSLWVEGPTDRKYLSKFLKLYCEHHDKQFLKEDIDFAFFEYGGNLIAHYLFDNENFEGDDSDVRGKINSFASSNKIYLIADEDNVKGSSKKGKRRSALEKLSNNTDNFEYQNTELREIENLLPKKTIKSFLVQIVDKQEVTNIDFKKSDYDKLGLGRFYEEQFKKHGILKKYQKAFLADSGTLKNNYKIKLCNFFINSDIKYEDIIEDNPVLEKIIQNLYTFIKE